MSRARATVRRALTPLAVMTLLAAVPRVAASDDASPLPADRPFVAPPAAVTAPRASGLEPLVPELAAHPYGLAPGVREYRNRLSVSPAYGTFGAGRLFTLRVAYNPNPWLGYEAAIAHNPGHSAHAVLHTFTAVVRRPLSGRIQPYACGGYGMIVVFPGQSVNADPVTKNALAVGGGAEFYIRSDLALRADLRSASVFGQQKDREGIVVYDYLQGTIGLAFYRSVQP